MYLNIFQLQDRWVVGCSLVVVLALLCSPLTLCSDVTNDDVTNDDVTNDDSEASDTPLQQQELEELGRSRRQTVKTLPRLPRQIFRHPQDPFSAPGPGSSGPQFIGHFGVSSGGGAAGASHTVHLPPVTLPPTRGPETMIQVVLVND